MATVNSTIPNNKVSLLPFDPLTGHENVTFTLEQIVKSAVRASSGNDTAQLLLPKPFDENDILVNDAKHKAAHSKVRKAIIEGAETNIRVTGAEVLLAAKYCKHGLLHFLTDKIIENPNGQIELTDINQYLVEIYEKTKTQPGQTTIRTCREICENILWATTNFSAGNSLEETIVSPVFFEIKPQEQNIKTNSTATTNLIIPITQNMFKRASLTLGSAICIATVIALSLTANGSHHSPPEATHTYTTTSYSIADVKISENSAAYKLVEKYHKDRSQGILVAFINSTGQYTLCAVSNGKIIETAVLEHNPSYKFMKDTPDFKKFLRMLKGQTTYITIPDNKGSNTSPTPTSNSPTKNKFSQSTPTYRTNSSQLTP